SAECSKEKWIVEEKDLKEVKNNLLKNVKNDLVTAFSEADKKKRGELINLAKEKSLALYKDSEQFTEMDVESQFKNIEKEIVRTKILKEKKRIDGRGLADIRPIKCEVGILPRAHGSALFTRGSNCRYNTWNFRG
ncbi:MAG: polyribonucleotide nucleotidyltransferase, partial [Pseudomonadota bacterium]